MLGCDALTLKRKDTLSARGWPPWEAASTGWKGTVTPSVPGKRRLQLASWLGGWWRAVAVRGVRWLCACGWGTASGANHFHQEQDDSHKGISLYVMVTAAAVVRTGWQPPWQPGTASGQWWQPPLQEEAATDWGDACLTLACNRLTITFRTQKIASSVMWLWEKTSTGCKMPRTKDASVRKISNTTARRPYRGPLSPSKILIFSLQGLDAWLLWRITALCLILSLKRLVFSRRAGISVVIRWQPLVLFSQSVLSDSLRPHRLQRARLPCPSPSPSACANSHPLSCWCHPTISSSVALFSSCPPSFASSGSFPRWWKKKKRVAIYNLRWLGLPGRLDICYSNHDFVTKLTVCLLKQP